MHYIIQKNLFYTENSHRKLIENMPRWGISHELVDVKPFVGSFEFKTDRKDVMVFGSVKMAQIATEYGWKPGSFYNANHDFLVYSMYYGEHMLNWEGEAIEFGDDLPEGLPYSFFARPTGDTKSFTGQLFTHHSWTEFVEMKLTDGHVNSPKPNTTVLVAPLKEIYREIRCWVVYGRIITASQYRSNNKTVYEECTEPAILNYASYIVDIYQPADAFVLDIAVTPKGLKVIEINCINCAGFYECDIYKLIDALESYGLILTYK